MRWVGLVAFAIFAVGCHLAGGNHRHVGTVRETLTPKAPVTSVRIANGVGAMEVRQATGADVVIEAEVWLAEGRAETDFTPGFADHVTVEETAGALTLGTVHAGKTDAQDWQLRLTVAVPAGVALELDQPVGHVRVELPETKGVRIHVATGAIEFAAPVVRGAMAIDVGTGSARIGVGTTGPTEGLTVACRTGQIAVALPGEVRGAFELSAGTGGLECDPRFGVHETRELAGVEGRGRVGDGGPTHVLRVGTGQIRLR